MYQKVLTKSIKSKGFDRPLDSASPSIPRCHANSSGNLDELNPKVLTESIKSKGFDRPLDSASHFLRTRK